MKTTIDIADELLERSKQIASEEGTTLKALAEEGLRLALARRESDRPIIEPLVFHGSGLRPGLPEDFIDNIRDWAYDEEPPV